MVFIQCTHSASSIVQRLMGIFEDRFGVLYMLHLFGFVCSVRRTFKKQGVTGFPLQDSKWPPPPSRGEPNQTGHRSSGARRGFPWL